MNQKGFVNVIIIGVITIIIAAAGYFALIQQKAVKAPAIKDKIELKTETGTEDTQTKKELELPLGKIKECPNATEQARISDIIGEPSQPFIWSEWTYQSYERLYVEFNKNPIRCDIDKRFQIVIKSEKPEKSPEKNVSLTPKMNAYLYDQNLNNEQLIASELNWAGPSPQSDIPDSFAFEFKPHNLIEITYNGIFPGKTLIVVNFLSKKKVISHLYTLETFPSSSSLTVVKNSKEWIIDLLTEENRVQKDIVKVKIKGLALNGKIFKPINLEKTYSSNRYGFDIFHGLKITDVKFSEDFSKVFFDAKISDLSSKEAELGKIEISLD